MKTLIIFAIAGALPLPLLGLSQPKLESPNLNQNDLGCGCSVEPAQTGSEDANGRVARNPTPARPPCPPFVDCVKTNTVNQTWCASGGIFQTCETEGDNDGDGIWGENHFLQGRTLEYWNCYTSNYVVCPPWQGLTVPGHPNQDQCCATSGSEPGCPTGSCY